MLIRTPLTEIERLILCNILTGDRMAGVTLANQKEHDDALVSLIRRGLVSYNGHRKRQKFLVTSAGRQQMDAEAKKQADATGTFAIGREDFYKAAKEGRVRVEHAEARQNEVRRGAVPPQATATPASPKDRDTADHVDAAGDGSAPAAIVQLAQDAMNFHIGTRRKFREIDGQLVEVDPNESDSPLSGAALRVVHIDADKGTITLGGEE